MTISDRKLLYVAYLFPPIGGGGVQRALHSANLLSELGWSVTILTENVERYQYDTYDWSLLSTLDSSISVYRPGNGGTQQPLVQKPEDSTPSESGKAKSTNGGQVATSHFSQTRASVKKLLFEAMHVLPDKYYNWIWQCWQERTQIRTHGPYDLILSSVRPASSMVLGWLLSKSMNLPLVVEYRDLWIGQEFHESRLLPTKEWFDTQVEHKILRDSVCVSVVTPAYKRILSSRYPDIAHKIRLYTNGYPDEALENKAGERVRHGTMVIRHFGRIYGTRDIGGLLAAVEKLIQEGQISEDEISLEFFGPPFSPAQQAQLAASQYKAYVKQPGYVALSDSFALQKSADLLLLVETTNDVYPGKVFEYLALRRPILGVLAREGILWQLLEQAGDHFLAAHDDPEAIRECLIRAIDLWRKRELRLQYVNEELVESFSRRRIVSEMSQEFIRIIEQHHSGIIFDANPTK